MKKIASIFIAVGLLLLIGCLYTPAIKGDFLTWDDTGQVVQNADIKSLSVQSIKKIFSSYYLAMYQPLTSLSYAIDYKIYGLNSFGYHLDNIILHLINSLLVFYLIKRISKNSLTACLTAVFFGIWPTQVETVAWISTRATLLFSTFFLIAMLAWIEYRTSNKKLFYFLATLSFLASLGARVTAVVLPIIFLVIDYAMNIKFDKKNILGKIPLFLISIVFGLVAIQARSITSTNYIEGLSWYFVFLRISYSFFLQLKNLIFPFDLQIIYYKPEFNNQLWMYVPALFLPVAAWLIFRKNKLSTAIVWFYTPIVLINVVLTYRLMFAGADRYTYIAGLAWWFTLALIITSAWDKFKKFRYIVLIVTAGIILTASWRSYNQAKAWQNDINLWTSNIEVKPTFFYPYQRRADVRYQAGDQVGALEDLKKACFLSPRGMADTEKSCARSFYNLGDYQKAAFHYNELLKISGGSSENYYNYGLTLIKSGDLVKGCEQLKLAETKDFKIADDFKQLCKNLK